jgi:uncharacterized membrane protein YphA (DoxX/SURF4 family)
MTIFQIPVANVLAWLLAVAFAGAGVVNAIGGANAQAQFVRWGYPAWWNFVTAALEILGAALILFPQTRLWGVALVAVVMIAAMATVTRRREYGHLPPVLGLTVLIAGELALVLGQT